MPGHGRIPCRHDVRASSRGAATDTNGYPVFGGPYENIRIESQGQGQGQGFALCIGGTPAAIALFNQAIVDPHDVRVDFDLGGDIDLTDVAIFGDAIGQPCP